MPISISIHDFPEELLEHVITLCVAASPIPTPASSPSWHTRTFITRRTSPLLVCKAFNRIGTPLLYHSINLTNPPQAELLLRTLRDNRDISPLIRCLVLSTITIHSAQALSLCRNLVLLDFTLEAGGQPSPPGPQVPTPDPDVVEFSNALSNLSQLRHLVVRKSGAGVYLTTPRVKHILCHLAEAVPEWNELVGSYDIASDSTPHHAVFQETTNFAFKFADDTPFKRPTPPGTPSDDSPLRLGPIARLTHALSTRPKLHSFAAHLPSTWSNAILRVGTNKRLERIVLSDGRSDICIIPEITGAMFSAPTTEHHHQHGVLGSGLFMMEARKHVKLIELIRAGTYVDHFLHCMTVTKFILRIGLSSVLGHVPWKVLRCRTCRYASDPYRSYPRGAQARLLRLLLPHRHRHHLLILRQGFHGGESPALLH